MWRLIGCSSPAPLPEHSGSSSRTGLASRSRHCISIQFDLICPCTATNSREDYNGAVAQGGKIVLVLAGVREVAGSSPASVTISNEERTLGIGAAPSGDGLRLRLLRRACARTDSAGLVSSDISLMKFGQLRSPNEAGYADLASIRGHDGAHRAFAAHGLPLLRRTNWSTVPVEERQEAVLHRINPRRTAVTCSADTGGSSHEPQA